MPSFIFFTSFWLISFETTFGLDVSLITSLFIIFFSTSTKFLLRFLVFLLSSFTSKTSNFPSSQVDTWLFNNVQAVCKKETDTRHFIVEFNETDSWKKGVYTDGANVISLDREKHYFDCQKPFRKTETKSNNILSKKCLDGLNDIKERSKKIQNVACLIAAYKREDILEKCIKSVKNQTVPVDIFIVGSCKEDKEVALKNNCFYLESENSPLSNKWQKGVDHIRDEGKYGALLILGSDDLISRNYVKTSLRYLRNEVAVVGKTRWQILNYDSIDKEVHNDFLKPL